MSQRTKFTIAVFKWDATEPELRRVPKKDFGATLHRIIGCELFAGLQIADTMTVYHDDEGMMNDNAQRPNMCFARYQEEGESAIFGTCVLAAEINGKKVDIVQEDLDELEHTLDKDMYQRSAFINAFPNCTLVFVDPQTLKMTKHTPETKGAE